MSTLQIALIQAAYDPAPGAMAEKYKTMVADAAGAGAQIVVLPELSMMPYLAGRARAARDTEPIPESVPHGETCHLLGQIARENGVFLVGSVYERGGLGFRKQKGARFNTAVLVDPEGNIGGGCRKQHVFDGEGRYETDYYGIGNSDYPLFQIKETVLAMPTGEDLWFPELPRIYALKGAGLIAAPAGVGGGAPYASAEAWQTMVRAHAAANGVFVAAANRVGTEDGTIFHGSSMIVAPGGKVLAQGSADREEVVTAELDLEMLTAWRKDFPLLLRREPQTYNILIARLTENSAEEPK